MSFLFRPIADATRIEAVGAPSRILSMWKTWELGAPHVGVEIVSDWDTSTGRMEQKLER